MSSAQSSIDSVSAERRWRTFLTIWSGHLVSLTGSRLTGFALAIWLLKQSGSVTLYGLLTATTLLPSIVLGPFAGALVDRWDRRKALLAGEIGGGVTTGLLALLLLTDQAGIGAVFALVGLASCFSALQFTGFSAATPSLVDNAQLERASGLTSLADAFSFVVAPACAGALLTVMEPGPILVLDTLSFAVAFCLMRRVRIPTVERTASSTSLWADLVLAWRFIVARRGFRALLVYFAHCNLTMGVVSTLVTPLAILYGPVGADGTAITAAGLGMVCGSLLVTATGGSRRRARSVTLAIGFQGAVLFLCGFGAHFAWVLTGAFLYMGAVPFLTASAEAIWQSKVELGLQGRVFAFRRLIASPFMPIGASIAGPLADHVFEPGLAADGALAASAGPLWGIGQGHGMLFMLSLVGGLAIVSSVFALLYRPIRNIETDLPDAINGPAPVAC